MSKARILAGDNDTWEVWIRHDGESEFHYRKSFASRKEAKDWCDASGLTLDD